MGKYERQRAKGKGQRAGEKVQVKVEGKGGG
jgi:hypothetical protein